MISTSSGKRLYRFAGFALAFVLAVCAGVCFLSATSRGIPADNTVCAAPKSQTGNPPFLEINPVSEWSYNDHSFFHTNNCNIKYTYHPSTYENCCFFSDNWILGCSATAASDYAQFSSTIPVDLITVYGYYKLPQELVDSKATISVIATTTADSISGQHTNDNFTVNLTDGPDETNISRKDDGDLDNLLGNDDSECHPHSWTGSNLSHASFSLQKVTSNARYIRVLAKTKAKAGGAKAKIQGLTLTITVNKVEKIAPFVPDRPVFYAWDGAAAPAAHYRSSFGSIGNIVNPEYTGPTGKNVVGGMDWFQQNNPANPDDKYFKGDVNEYSEENGSDIRLVSLRTDNVMEKSFSCILYDHYAGLKKAQLHGGKQTFDLMNFEGTTHTFTRQSSGEDIPDMPDGIRQIDVKAFGFENASTTTGPYRGLAVKVIFDGKRMKDGVVENIVPESDFTYLFKYWSFAGKKGFQVGVCTGGLDYTPPHVPDSLNYLTPYDRSEDGTLWFYGSELKFKIMAEDDNRDSQDGVWKDVRYSYDLKYNPAKPEFDDDYPTTVRDETILEHGPAGNVIYGKVGKPLKISNLKKSGYYMLTLYGEDYAHVLNPGAEAFQDHKRSVSFRFNLDIGIKDFQWLIRVEVWKDGVNRGYDGNWTGQPVEFLFRNVDESTYFTKGVSMEYYFTGTRKSLDRAPQPLVLHKDEEHNDLRFTVNGDRISNPDCSDEKWYSEEGFERTYVFRLTLASGKVLSFSHIVKFDDYAAEKPYSSVLFNFDEDHPYADLLDLPADLGFTVGGADVPRSLRDYDKGSPMKLICSIGETEETSDMWAYDVSDVPASWLFVKNLSGKYFPAPLLYMKKSDGGYEPVLDESVLFETLSDGVTRIDQNIELYVKVQTEDGTSEFVRAPELVPFLRNEVSGVDSLDNIMLKPFWDKVNEEVLNVDAPAKRRISLRFVDAAGNTGPEMVYENFWLDTAKLYLHFTSKDVKRYYDGRTDTPEDLLEYRIFKDRALTESVDRMDVHIGTGIYSFDTEYALPSAGPQDVLVSGVYVFSRAGSPYRDLVDKYRLACVNDSDPAHVLVHDISEDDPDIPFAAARHTIRPARIAVGWYRNEEGNIVPYGGYGFEYSGRTDFLVENQGRKSFACVDKAGFEAGEGYVEENKPWKHMSWSGTLRIPNPDVARDSDRNVMAKNADIINPMLVLPEGLWVCPHCGHVYDETAEGNCAFAALPENWVCPCADCHGPKADFLPESVSNFEPSNDAGKGSTTTRVTIRPKCVTIRSFAHGSGADPDGPEELWKVYDQTNSIDVYPRHVVIDGVVMEPVSGTPPAGKQLYVREYIYSGTLGRRCPAGTVLYVSGEDGSYLPAPVLYVQVVSYEPAPADIPEGTDLYVKNEDGSYASAPADIPEGTELYVKNISHERAPAEIPAGTDLYVSGEDGSYAAAPALFFRTERYVKAPDPVPEGTETFVSQGRLSLQGGTLNPEGLEFVPAEGDDEAVTAMAAKYGVLPEGRYYTVSVNAVLVGTEGANAQNYVLVDNFLEMNPLPGNRYTFTEAAVRPREMKASFKLLVRTFDGLADSGKIAGPGTGDNEYTLEDFLPGDTALELDLDKSWWETPSANFGEYTFLGGNPAVAHCVLKGADAPCYYIGPVKASGRINRSQIDTIELGGIFVYDKEGRYWFKTADGTLYRDRKGGEAAYRRFDTLGNELEGVSELPSDAEPCVITEWFSGGICVLNDRRIELSPKPVYDFIYKEGDTVKSVDPLDEKNMAHVNLVLEVSLRTSSDKDFEVTPEGVPQHASMVVSSTAVYKGKNFTVKAFPDFVPDGLVYTTWPDQGSFSYNVRYEGDAKAPYDSKPRELRVALPAGYRQRWLGARVFSDGNAAPVVDVGVYDCRIRIERPSDGAVMILEVPLEIEQASVRLALSEDPSAKVVKYGNHAAAARLSSITENVYAHVGVPRNSDKFSFKYSENRTGPWSSAVPVGAGDFWVKAYFKGDSNVKSNESEPGKYTVKGVPVSYPSEADVYVCSADEDGAPCAEVEPVDPKDLIDSSCEGFAGDFVIVYSAPPSDPKKQPEFTVELPSVPGIHYYRIVHRDCVKNGVLGIGNMHLTAAVRSTSEKDYGRIIIGLGELASTDAFGDDTGAGLIRAPEGQILPPLREDQGRLWFRLDEISPYTVMVKDEETGEEKEEARGSLGELDNINNGLYEQRDALKNHYEAKSVYRASLEADSDTPTPISLPTEVSVTMKASAKGKPSLFQFVYNKDGTYEVRKIEYTDNRDGTVTFSTDCLGDFVFAVPYSGKTRGTVSAEGVVGGIAGGIGGLSAIFIVVGVLLKAKRRNTVG